MDSLSLNANLVEGDMLSLPYTDELFDSILCRNVISHQDTSGVKKIIGELKRVLKPGGECYLTLGSKSTWGFKQTSWPLLDENTRLRMEEGPEYEIPHFYADYDLIKENIKDNYKLVKYVKDKSKLCELVNLNEKVLLLLDGKYLTEELVENEINKSDFISEVFLGIYGSDNDLFKYSSYYKNIKNIDKILFEQL